MRQLLISLLFIISISLFGQETDTSIDRRIAFLLNKFRNKTADGKDSIEIRTLTYQIQNKGFYLEERSRDFKGSLIEIDKALSIWIATNDTLNQANLRKYRGYLLGYLQRFPEAKKEIQLAMYLYRLKNRDFGVAVSEFDLSRVYELESKFDSALYFANSALRYWKTRKDTSRIIGLNSQLINLFCKTNEYNKAEILQKESEPLTNLKNLHWRDLLDFYLLSIRVYENLNRNNLANKYKKLYRDKVRIISKEENIMAKSNY